MTVRVAAAFGDEPWYQNTLYGREVPDELWQRYQTALEAVGDLEYEMEGCPYVDDRPPPTELEKTMIDHLLGLAGSTGQGTIKTVYSPAYISPSLLKGNKP